MRFRSCCAALAGMAVAGCFAITQAQERERFRDAVASAPPMINPAVSGKVDGTLSGNWDSKFRLVSYSRKEACFRAEWNVPPELAPTLPFRLEGWRSLDGEDAPHVMAHRVEVLDSSTLARVAHHERQNEELSAHRTAMRVCFASPTVIDRATRFLVIRVEVNERHRTGAAWRMVARAPVLSRR